eukprot:783187_1
MFRIAEYLTNVVRKAVQVGIDKSLDYWGIAGIKHKFIHKRDDILRFNNQNLMKSIIQNREREKQAVNSLSMDEYGLRQLFKIDEQRKYDPMMGTLLTDEDMKYLWRVFEESNYEQRKIYVKTRNDNFEYNAPLPGNLIGLEDIVTALDNDDVYADIEGIIEQSRAKAMATAEVDRILKEMQEIEENNILNDTQDEKECADSCYWTKESGEINVRFKGRDTSNYITCDISNFKIPIIRDASKSNISRNLLYCPDLWTYLLKTIIFIPCFSSMSTGGTDKETNMQAEGVNRHFKHVEGMRNMRIDRYLSQRSIVQFEMTIYFCTRIREKNAQSMIKGSLLHDMWSGKGHVKSAESAFDLLAIDLFLKLIQYENTMDAKMGYKRLHSATMNLFKETGFAHVYSLDELSMNLFYKLKWHKSIDYKAAAFVTRQSYFILWMIYRLMARHKVSVDVMYDQYPQLEGLGIFDFKKDEDVDENMS